MTQTFGAMLRHLRRKNGMTQEQLAERLGYSRSMVAALETDRRFPDIETIHSQIVPALDLGDSLPLVDQMVELVARARPTAPRPALPTVPRVPRASYTEGEGQYRVPMLPSRLIGRDRELQSICDQFLYHNVRLMTLIGPPGVGKTSLALSIAERLQWQLPNGACFVPLAGVANPKTVPSAILEALGAQQHAGLAEGKLIAHLRHKELVLVLDNFEQLLDAAPLVANVLAECAEVRILVTSRERLHLRAEHLHHVRPLAIEDAVELFVTRAAAVSPDMQRSQIDTSISEAICRRLDCLPLAIELCAAQLDLDTPEQILDRMRSRPLETLVDGSVDLPARHRTLRAAIDSSYHLLSPSEKRLMQALAVFVGGCTPTIVEETWTDDVVAATQTDKLLRSLASKSLIRMGTTEWGDARVTILESVREFALERLGDEGDLAAVRARHFDAVSRHMRLAESRMWFAGGNLWLKRILQEQDNLIEALEWAYEQERWSAIGSLLCILTGAFRRSVRQQEFTAWFERLLPFTDLLHPDMTMVIKMEFCYAAHDERLREEQRRILAEFWSLYERCENPLIKAYALYSWGDMRVDHPHILEYGQEAIQFARNGRTTEELTSVFGYGFSREWILPYTLFMNGCGLYMFGESVEAEAYMRESLQLSREFHCFSTTGWNLGYLARIALSRGNPDEAVALAESALEHVVAEEDAKGTAAWRGFLGLVSIHMGDLAKARQTLEQAWAECCVYGDPFTSQIPAIFLCELALYEGDLEDARRWLAESMSLSANSSRDIFWRHIHRSMLAAWIAAREGRDRRAAQLYGFMHGYSDRIMIGSTGPVRDTAAATMAEVRARLGEQSYWDAYKRGREMPVKETLANLMASLD